MHTRILTVVAFYLFVCVFIPCFASECVPFYCSLESEGSIIDCNGVITGSLTFVPGVDGNAANFDGASDVNFTDNIFDVPAGSISLWFKKNSGHNCGGIWQIGSLGQKSSMGLFYNSQDCIYFEIKNESLDLKQVYALDSISEGNDTHIVCTWEQRETSNFIKLFVNGKSSPNVYWAELSGDFIHNENPLVIGRDDCHGNGEGVIDELRFFDWALSDAEVYAEYVYSSNRYINQPTSKPVSTGPVRVVGKTLTVNDKPFTIKGVGYQPTPIGMEPNESTREYMYSDPNIIARDVNYLKKMNVNTIRIWSRLPDAGVALLDALEGAGIYVIMGFDVNSSGEQPDVNYADPCTINHYKNRMTQYVNTFKDHPVVLAWGIGNENNLHYQGHIPDWYKLANELARVAYEAEEPNYHPTMVINGQMLYFGNIDCNSDDASLNYVDIWGHNAYTYYDYHCYFDYFDKLSAKPLVMTEFGVDAYDNVHSCEYQDVQADWVVHEWLQIKDESLGGTVMAYSDEWWKSGLPSHHGTGGFNADTQPDRFANEEWWGLMWVEDNGDLRDNMYPREAFNALGNEFYEVTLIQGWNLISFTRLPVSDANDVNIPLRKGWNVFGYSNYQPFYWSDANVSDGIETKTLDEAASAGWLQLTIYYYDSSSALYCFVPGDDDFLRQDKVYWLYALEDDLTLTLPNAGGSSPSNSFYWHEAQIYDGNETMSIEQAQQEGLLQGTIYYFDEDTQYYKFIPGDDDQIYPWRGYWLYSIQDNLTLVLGAGQGGGIVAPSKLFDLQFEHYIDNGSTPDTFNAIGSTDPNISEGIDSKDVRQAPCPPYGDYVQAYPEPNGVHVTKDYRPFDPNAADVSYLIDLIAFDDGFVGLTGTAYFNLAGPNALNDIPPDALVILTRCEGGTPVQNYDLRDPNNHSIDWPVVDVLGVHGTMELRIINKCLAANLDGVYPVNFKDYAVLANDWMQIAPLDGDINGNNVTDWNDLEILAYHWLSDCD